MRGKTVARALRRSLKKHRGHARRFAWIIATHAQLRF
jgi:hypothetical protein